MEVKEAVAKAKSYVKDLFAEENPANLGLEEVEYSDADREWRITIGFTRPWDKPKFSFSGIMRPPDQGQRSYKVVRISDDTGDIRSLKNHEIVH